MKEKNKKVIQTVLFYKLSIFLISILLFSHFYSKQKAYAVVYIANNNTDFCGVHLQFKEIPVCIASQQQYIDVCTPRSNQYEFDLLASSTDGKDHTVYTQWYSDQCNSGKFDMSGGYAQCVDNPQQGTHDLNTRTSSFMRLVRTSPDGTACGTYQMDVNILGVDRVGHCQQGNGGGAVYATGLASDVTDCGSGPPPTPTPTPIPTYSISGIIYNDKNKDKYYEPGVDSQYTGPNTLTFSGANLPTPKTITVNQARYDAKSNNINLPSGTYTVHYTIPNNYSIFYPNSATFTVTVGTNCSIPPQFRNDASCDSNGNVISLNFALTNEYAWIQSICSDWRMDGGITNPVPAGGTCGPISNKYGLTTSSLCSDPGIFTSGNQVSNFNPGNISAKNWIAGGTAYSELFTPVHPKIIRTSYNYMLTTIQQSGIIPTDLSGIDPLTNNPYCQGGLTNCQLEPNLPHGIYIANSDLTLQQYTFQPLQNYIFLVNGNLTIKDNILVPSGSNAIFSVGYPTNPQLKGNIIIDAAVGQSLSQINTIQDANIQGLFSADNSFIINSNINPSSNKYCNPDASSLDRKLNITGSVTVNAAWLSPAGTIQNNRDLCNMDTICPVVSVSWDTGNVSGNQPNAGIGVSYILNAPTLIKHKDSLWQETNP